MLMAWESACNASLMRAYEPVSPGRHPGMLLAGLNLPGADLNSLRLVRRMKYMDVFHNPVAFLTLIGRFVRG
jgi:hypothetical protein